MERATLEKDLYAILGVSQKATEAEIRRAFHKLARQYHPDVNPGDDAAELKFKEINFAYEVLKDKQKRGKYDQLRAAGTNPFAGAHAGGSGGTWRQGGSFNEAYSDFGLGDLFEEIFGGGGAGGARHKRGAKWSQGTMARKGGDQETALTISFLEAATGGERYLELSDGRKLTVKIPKAVATGSKIKLKGQGQPGLGGGPAGDLIIELKVLPHAYFKREGKNILLDLPLTFSEAVLGAEVEVPTLTGKVHMKIPAGISSGQRLKLKGKGIEIGGTTGDQFVEVSIRVPKSPSPECQELARKLQTEDFNPRSF